MYLQIENLKKFYGQDENKVEVLRGINCGIEKSEICVMLGPSGSGKSTLLNLIGGIETIDEGDIVVGDVDLGKLSNKDLTLYRRNTLGFVFQFYHLVPNLTVKENIESGAYLSKKPISVDELLKTLGLEEHQNKYPHLRRTPLHSSCSYQQKPFDWNDCNAKPYWKIADRTCRLILGRPLL